MEMWTEIRRKVLLDGASKRSIRRNYRVSARTLEKILVNAEPPGYRQRTTRPKPMLGQFLPVIDEILEADKTAPPKQRHTAKRIYERLRDEYGYTGCSSQVRRAVARSKHHSKEVFVPLSHPPGHAQFDFGEATVVIAGVEVKAALAVMTLPYSDAYFVSAYPRECTETFQAGHVAVFEFFGGVPVRTSYDNTSIAVKKVMGRERELTTEFLRLESHFVFGHHFCRVGRGNEKGHVETHVGYARRNLLVPVPRFSSFAEMNEYLAGCCYADLFRRVRGKPETKAERLVIDQAAMLALPAESFEARRVEQRGANSLSLVRFDRNDYSVPTAFAHHDITAVGTDGIRAGRRDQKRLFDSPGQFLERRRFHEAENLYVLTGPCRAKVGLEAPAKHQEALREVPVLEWASDVQGTGLSFQKGQVVAGVEADLFFRPAPRVGGHDLGADEQADIFDP